MLCETSGEFMAFINDSPGEGFKIQTIASFSRGFIIGCSNGYMFVYERIEDPRYHYRRIKTIEASLDQSK